MITDTLPAVEPEPLEGPTSRRRRRWAVIALVLLILVGGLAARAWWPERKADIRAGTTAVTNDQMAARYGISVSLIGVTAARGLIDFRYRVVDPEKAAGVLHDASLAPILVVEDTGATLVLSTPPHHHATELQLGGTYFFLVANAHNAIHDGSPVTLVIGDLRLEHIVAQG